MRPIDADKFGQYLADEQLANRGWKEDYCDLLDDVMDALDNAPTIDPESLRPQGEWVLEHETYGEMICSICRHKANLEKNPTTYANGLSTLLYAESNYCPNCGANMKGAGEDAKAEIAQTVQDLRNER